MAQQTHDDAGAPVEEDGTSNRPKDPKKPSPSKGIPGQSENDEEPGIAENQGGGIDGAIGGGQSGQGGG